MPNITVQWYAGRTDQQKREITAAITEAMVTIGKTTAELAIFPDAPEPIISSLPVRSTSNR